MGFRCGIVGLPNVGKSTLFNALTRSRSADAANYPFCTIDPNLGVVEVPDQRLQQLSELVKPQKTVPTTIEFVDIAGLVAGASQGEGLGNRFLAHIREVDAIAHVVRAFEDQNISHVDDRIDPESDIETIQTELMLADMETADRSLQRAIKAGKSGDKEQIATAALLEKVKNHLAQGQMLRSLVLDADSWEKLKPLCLLTAKPVLYIANVHEDGFQDNPKLEMLKRIASREQSEVIAICATIEQELSELDVIDEAMFLEEMGLKESGLNRLIRAGYNLLGLLTFFTAGEKEVRAWTVNKDSNAPKAAGVIHSDFEKGFIRAETISFEDYIQYRGEQGAREAGRMRLEGKDYVVADGDVMHFLFNV